MEQVGDSEIKFAKINFRPDCEYLSVMVDNGTGKKILTYDKEG